MSKFKNQFKFIINKLCLLFVISIGLLTIIGTGADDDDDKTTIETANNPPVAQIDSPAASSVYSLNDSITFTGSATDAEDLVIAGDSLIWTSSKGGEIGYGSNFTTKSLSRGSHEITLTAIDSKNSADSTSISININPESNTLPVANITNPPTGSSYNYKNFIAFAGTGYDTEDNLLSGNSLVWYSNKDGQLGTGNTIKINTLSGGTHIISLTATDSFQTSHTSTITITIINTAPIATINYPPDGSTFSSGDAIAFDGAGTDTEDGNLTESSLVWTADNYGIIGVGTNISIDYLPPGTDITINLKAVDSGSLVDSDTITITILP